jgi:hypothetical protein
LLFPRAAEEGFGLLGAGEHLLPKDKPNQRFHQSIQKISRGQWTTKQSRRTSDRQQVKPNGLSILVPRLISVSKFMQALRPMYPTTPSLQIRGQSLHKVPVQFDPGMERYG